jgi:hypothetical protein
MTWKPEDIVVSGAEVAEFKRLIEEGHGTGFALAAFLAARMPEKKPNSGISLHVGYNAALDAVAKGKGT